MAYIDQFFDNTLGVTFGYARLDSPIVGKELSVILRQRYIATWRQKAMCWVRFFDFRSTKRIWKKSETVF